MKKFFGEFKTFITRGNVLDMSVGIIVGGAFTAIVNGMSNFILKPLVNALLAVTIGAETLSELYTVLIPIDENGNRIIGEVSKDMIDLTQSIYIDWGSFINAVLSFFITAFVLFIIVRFINKLKENQSKVWFNLTPEQRAELKANGIDIRKKEAVEAYFAEKQKAADAAAAEKARLDREANPTTEDLLKEILAEMKKN